MKIRLAGHAGFCMGVRKALELVLKEAEKGERIYTYGPIIHNPQVLQLLEGKGIGVLKEDESSPRGTVVIRAHGAAPEVFAELEEKGLRVVDGTCPKVRLVQRLVNKNVSMGRDVVILGEPQHPEVIGLVGHGKGRPFVIQGPEEIQKLPPLKEPIFLAQTTQERDRFLKTREALEKLYPGLKTYDTICSATKERQEEAKEIARKVDLVLVVGGRESGNTKRLLDVAKGENPNSYQVETDGEIDPSWFVNVKSVGITAGASTPNWMIIRVLRRLEEIQQRYESFFIRTVRHLLRFVFFTGILSSLALFSLAMGIMGLQGDNRYLRFPATSALLFLSLIIIARYVDKESMNYNDPSMYGFLMRFRRVVLVMGVSSFVLGTWLAHKYLGVWELVLSLLMALAVMGYSFQKRFGLSKIFSFPGLRTLGEAFIFMFLSGPFLHRNSWIQDPFSQLFPTLLCATFAITKSLFQDILRFQGDLLMGERSLSVTFDTERLLRWTFVISGLQMIITVGLILTGNIYGFPLLLASFAFLFCLLGYKLKLILIGSRLEMLAELSFVLIIYTLWLQDWFLNKISWTW